MMNHPACSPFAARVSVEVVFRGEFYIASALPLGEEVSGFRFWEIFVTRFDRTKIFVVSQTKRTRFGPGEVIEHVAGFVSDGRF